MNEFTLCLYCSCASKSCPSSGKLINFVTANIGKTKAQIQNDFYYLVMLKDLRTEI